MPEWRTGSFLHAHTYIRFEPGNFLVGKGVNLTLTAMQTLEDGDGGTRRRNEERGHE